MPRKARKPEQASSQPGSPKLPEDGPCAALAPSGFDPDNPDNLPGGLPPWEEWHELPDLDDLPERIPPTGRPGRTLPITRDWLRKKLPQIEAAIETGLPIDLALGACGLIPNTISRWLRAASAKDAHPLLAYFALRLGIARARHIHDTIGRLKTKTTHGLPAKDGSGGSDGARGPWQIDAWFAERGFPEHFALRQPAGPRASGACGFASIDPTKEPTHEEKTPPKILAPAFRSAKHRHRQ